MGGGASLIAANEVIIRTRKNVTTYEKIEEGGREIE